MEKKCTCTGNERIKFKLKVDNPQDAEWAFRKMNKYSFSSVSVMFVKYLEKLVQYFDIVAAMNLLTIFLILA